MKTLWMTMIAIFALATGCAAEGELADVESGPVDAGVALDSARPDASVSTDLDGSASDVDASNAICDIFAPACPGGEKCVPIPRLEQSICVANSTEIAIGEPCQRVTECVEGAACIDDGESTRCRELCDPEDVQSCSGTETYCTQTLGSDPSIGVCETAPEPCDIYAQDCASGDCVLGRRPNSETVAPLCGSAGTVAEGAPCGGDAGSCQAGLICIQTGADTVPTCHAVCRDPDAPCTSGACTGTSAAGIDFCV